TFVPSAAILPSRSTIVPFWTVPRVTVTSVAFRMATTAAAVRGWARGCPSQAMAKQKATRRTTRIRRALITTSTTVLRLESRRLRVEQVLVEPLQIVLHRRAMALGFRRTMSDTSKALIHDELRRDVIVLQALIELVRIRQRHALVRRAMLDERRRLRLFDVGDRRRLRVNLRIVPRRGLQVLPREPVDVGVHLVRHPAPNP